MKRSKIGVLIFLLAYDYWIERVVVEDWRGTWILLSVYVSTPEDEVVKERLVCFSSWSTSGRGIDNGVELNEVVIL